MKPEMIQLVDGHRCMEVIPGKLTMALVGSLL